MVRDGYIYGLSLLAVAVVLAWATGHWAWSIAPVLLAAFFLWFFRDPERTIPSGTGLIVSPGDGLVILPTHRVVHSLPSFDAEAFATAAEEFFTVEASELGAAIDYMEWLGRQAGTAFVAVTRGGALLLRSKPEAVAAALAGMPERQRQLDLSHLHSIVLDRLLGLDAEKVREPVSYTHLCSGSGYRLRQRPRAGPCAHGGRPSF